MLSTMSQTDHRRQKTRVRVVAEKKCKSVNSTPHIEFYFSAYAWDPTLQLRNYIELELPTSGTIAISTSGMSRNLFQESA